MSDNPKHPLSCGDLFTDATLVLKLTSEKPAFVRHPNGTLYRIVIDEYLVSTSEFLNNDVAMKVLNNGNVVEIYNGQTNESGG